MVYRNHEGYSDPTAGKALANICREERCKRKSVYVQRYSTPEKQNHHPPRRHRYGVTKEVNK